MAIMAYTGVMGSGKTYEAVSTAALTALKAGRRVVTNVSGFNFDKVREHLGSFPDGSVLEAEKIVVVHSKRITEPHFFHDPESSTDSVVKPGDLVLVDEVWAFWGTDVKLTPEHQKFFRMHRHYTEVGTGVSCDLVIMIQDLSSLHRFIKGVLESNFKFTKMKTLGLSSRYRVEVYEGNKQRKASLVSVSNKKYDKRIFPLYKSYDGGVGKESVVDDRQNLFKNKFFLFVMASALSGLIGGSVWFYSYIKRLRGPAENKVAAGTVTPASNQNLKANGITPVLTGPASIPSLSRSQATLVGVWSSSKAGGQALIKGADGRYEFVVVRAGVIDGWSSQVQHDGANLSFSFGAPAK